jgi:hypothetical protein
MSNSIRIGKHGVNPTLGICFWCGEETGEIGLLGVNGGKEASMHSVLGYEPCDKCKESWNQGTPVLEANSTPNVDKQPIFGGAYPTGRYVVLRHGALNIDIPIGKPVFMRPEDFNNLLEQFKKAEENNGTM